MQRRRARRGSLLAAATTWQHMSHSLRARGGGVVASEGLHMFDQVRYMQRAAPRAWHCAELACRVPSDAPSTQLCCLAHVGLPCPGSRPAAGLSILVHDDARGARSGARVVAAVHLHQPRGTFTSHRMRDACKLASGLCACPGSEPNVLGVRALLLCEGRPRACCMSWRSSHRMLHLACPRVHPWARSPHGAGHDGPAECRPMMIWSVTATTGRGAWRQGPSGGCTRPGSRCY